MNVAANGANAKAGLSVSDMSIFRTALEQFRPKTPAMAVQRAMLLVLIVAVVALAIANPVFRNPANLLNIIQQASMVGVIACGMQLMIISGGFDLSVGATAAAAGCLAAAISLVSPGCRLASQAACSGHRHRRLNGSLVSKVGINPFVATFGMQAVDHWDTLAMTNARPIAPLPREWREHRLLQPWRADLLRAWSSLPSSSCCPWCCASPASVSTSTRSAATRSGPPRRRESR